MSQDLVVEFVKDITIVKVIDGNIIYDKDIKSISEQISDLVDIMSRKKILMDLADVRYLASALIGKLVTLAKELKIGEAYWYFAIFIQACPRYFKD